MTREEIYIEKLSELRSKYSCFDKEEEPFYHALSLGIKGIKALEQEPNYNEWCTDCKEYNHEKHCCPRFNRVIQNTLKEMEAQPSEDAYEKAFKDGYDAAMKVAELLPPVIPARPKGEWLDEWDKDHIVVLASKCSKCGTYTNTKPNFCPNCGAKMEEVSECK